MSEKPESRIPEHQEGTAVNVEDSVSLPNAEEAKKFFQQVKERLLNVNSWHGFAGSLSADFQLTDPAGNPVDRRPQKEDFFRISIPAPGIQTGEGYDWVRVEEIVERVEDDEEFTSVRVRPASSPLNDHADVAHFYTDEATSNFIVKRQGRNVSAGVYGRNEKPNVNAAENLLDKVRNAIVGTGGVTGFSKLQWKALVSGLLAKEN
ncbi:hypothetical protein [Flavisolibacter nicotianae]|uniref:hypothetical protein n=1 Tax=Flavisolibacter nicotianae TaxID=2364882 RepID=UPI000EAC399D|nr:hypothetical protein [Flavisolibacter nicotianae]